MHRYTAIALLSLAPALGCRTAVIAEPRTEDDTQTVVTVEERPKTSEDDKEIIIIDKRD